MATPLATIEALEARLGRTLEGTDLDMGNAALADASIRVRAYGLPWADPTSAPDLAVAITLAAAERRMRNPDNLRQELEGSYQYSFAVTPLGVELTDEEVKMLQRSIGAFGVYSVQVESLGGVL